MFDSLEDFDANWTELNSSLRHVEANKGLADALADLEASQRQTGFIKDDLRSVERYVYPRPNEPERHFRIQFNPRRLERFNGAGISLPPNGIEVTHGGCFLCRDNVRWQQQGRELGFELDVDGREYHAWMNPFPLMPRHIVVASRMHETQDWSHGPQGGVEPRMLMGELAKLASRMPGFVGFYNGVDAGASIAGHLHYQFFQRPEVFPEFPLEAHMRGLSAEAGSPVIVNDYAVPVVKWCGKPEFVANAAADWIDDWAHRNAERIYRLTANIIATADQEGPVTLYFVARDRSKSRGNGMSGLVGGLEVLGELVFSSPEERRLIDGGSIDYFVIKDILGSVRTPLFIDEE